MELKPAFIAFLVACLEYSVFGCPDDFMPWHEGYCYRIGDVVPYFAYAAWNCRNSSAELASFHSQLETTRIIDALSTTGVTDVWVGLHCVLTGDIEWVDRSQVDFLTELTQNCPSYAALKEPARAFALMSGKLNSRWHNDHFPGLCRHRRRNGDRCSDYDEIDGACISVRLESQTWWTAEEKCQQEGGHLLSIHDQRMNEHIRKMVSNAELVGISGLFLIGMQTQASPKGETYTWSDGSTVNYTNYETGMPTDFLGQCTAMQTTAGGKWISTKCAESNLPYICSRPVNDPIQAPGCLSNPNFKDCGTILSPSYPASSGPIDKCDYILTVASGMKVNLIINDFNTNLCCDKLFLFDGLTNTTPFATVSGKANQTSYVTPTSNILKMTYTSTDGTFVRGWKVTFKGV